uniref:Uncharacterized protein LOC104220815 n=1 Tax=Nicotiana sylvestris TaxID=4096 RepID=A0A1U7VQ78_NICSY
LHLKAKRKLGFITGTCIKTSFEADLHEECEICNAIVHSWIMNSVSKDLLSGIIYASDAHAAWEDLKERFDKDLYSGIVKGIGKETDGLYLLNGRGTWQLVVAFISTL